MLVVWHMPEIHRYRRLLSWDYSKGASLFVTIAVEPRRPLLGRVVDGKVQLSNLGAVVDEALAAIPRLNPGIELFERVVMPDHVHFRLWLKPGLPAPLKTLGKAIGRFKNYTTKQAKGMGLAGHSPAISTGHSPAISTEEGAARGDGRAAPGQLWQQGYHDWLALNREVIAATARYIAYNPLKWQLMYGQPGYLRIKEPLVSPRLDPGSYWKGVGNTALLDPATPTVALRVSMKVTDFAPVLQRIDSAIEKGWIILSGFISKGERAVLRHLAARTGARFIRIRPSCIPTARFKPESLLADAFAENRLLEIAKGNDEVEFGRRACLDLNDEIVKIAVAGNGLALHWRADGPHVTARSGDGKSTTFTSQGWQQ